MATKFLVVSMDVLSSTPAQVIFADHAGDYSPSTNNVQVPSGMTPIEGELVLLDLGIGVAAQTAKIDLGARYAAEYSVDACIEIQVAAVDADGVVEFYWNASPSGTAAVANKGGASGAAASYDGYSADLESAVKQLDYIGNMVFTDDTVDSVQTGFCGMLYPKHRYGSLVIWNRLTQIICTTDDIESCVTLSPTRVPEAQ